MDIIKIISLVNLNIDKQYKVEGSSKVKSLILVATQGTWLPYTDAGFLLKEGETLYVKDNNGKGEETVRKVDINKVVTTDVYNLIISLNTDNIYVNAWEYGVDMLVRQIII